ncbi:MAG: hypothetical protein ACLTZT_16660 [Butyricimonas faecalis]
MIGEEPDWVKEWLRNGQGSSGEEGKADKPVDARRKRRGRRLATRKC